MDNYRLGAFALLFILIALWELVFPRRPLQYAKGKRWLSNLSLSFINSGIQLALGLSLLHLALFVQQQGWGLFHHLHWSITLEIILGWLALDFGIYLQHVMSHHLPLLWRFHQVHHADLDFDVTTGVRFHPIEIIVSFFYKALLILALGPSPGSVIMFEILLNLGSTFNHGNIYIPPKLDAFLRWFVVTPDMHRIHHSQKQHEANTNFSFSISWWDRLCGTYLKEAQVPQKEIEFGLDYVSESAAHHLIKIIFKLPLITKDNPQ